MDDWTHFLALQETEIFVEVRVLRLSLLGFLNELLLTSAKSGVFNNIWKVMLIKVFGIH